MRSLPILFLLLIAGLCLPLTLRGQSQATDTLSSIVGKTFFRMEIGIGGLDNVDVPVSGIDVVLVAGKDTVRTKTDNLGRFSFSRIKTRQVTLSMVDDDYAPFSESFVLMPGESIVIVPRQRLDLYPDHGPVIRYPRLDARIWTLFCAGYLLPLQQLRRPRDAAIQNISLYMAEKKYSFISSPSRQNVAKKKENRLQNVSEADFGAVGESRTHTPHRALPPQSSVSTISPLPQLFGTANIRRII